MAGEGEDEHATARALIERIRATTEPSRELTELIAELELVVVEHADAEETEVLPQVRAVLERDRLEALGREFEAAKG